MELIAAFTISLPGALLAALFLLFLFLFKGSFAHRNHFLFSTLSFFPETESISYAKRAMQLSWMFLLAALIDPHFEKTVQSVHEERAPLLFLLLDTSSSMQGKMEILKKEVEDLLLGFKENAPLVGLATFARTAEILSPPTYDYASLLSLVKKIEAVPRGDQDGTAMGYALYKTAHVIAEKEAAIVMVTDGFDMPSSLDKGNRRRSMRLVDAADYLKEEKIRLYLINVDPLVNSVEYSDLKNHLEKVATSTGGAFYAAGIEDIEPLFKGLAKKFHSSEGRELHERSYSLYPFFILISMGSLLLSLTLQAGRERSFP